MVHAPLDGVLLLVSRLLDRAGWRLFKALTRLIKNLDSLRQQVLIRDDKGQKDLVTLLPGRCVSGCGRRTRSRGEDDKRTARGPARPVPWAWSPVEWPREGAVAGPEGGQRPGSRLRFVHSFPPRTWPSFRAGYNVVFAEKTAT